jgi:hypothetical protein
MPTVTALKKGYMGVYGQKEKGDTWLASPRQAALLEEQKLVEVLKGKAAEKALEQAETKDESKPK